MPSRPRRLRSIAWLNLGLSSVAIFGGIALFLFGPSAPGDLLFSVLLGPLLTGIGFAVAAVWVFVLRGHRWAYLLAAMCSALLVLLVAGAGALLFDSGVVDKAPMAAATVLLVAGFGFQAYLLLSAFTRNRASRTQPPHVSGQGS